MDQKKERNHKLELIPYLSYESLFIINVFKEKDGAIEDMPRITLQRMLLMWIFPGICQTAPLKHDQLVN